MNKAKSIIRIAILLILGITAVGLLFGMEQNKDNTSWFIHFVLDKAFAIGTIWCIVRLYNHWSKIDPWFIAYDKMCDEVMNKPNPTQL